MDPAQDVSGLSPTVHLGKGPSQLTGAMLKNWIKTKLASGTFSKRAPSSAPLKTERDQLNRSGVDPRLAVPGIILGRINLILLKMQ